MARDTTDTTPATSIEDLVGHLKQGEKPASEFRIGTEHEKFGYYAHDLSPVPYEGERGIEALLQGLQALSGWDAIVDDGRIIGLAGGPGQGAISLEPGGQFELSGAPVRTLHETQHETAAHLSDVRTVAEALGIAFLGLGASPLWTLGETPLMPKSRYDIMRNYMPKVGSRGLDMMYRTATIQVNLDFSSEADMRRKMQVGMRLQPIASALFAYSPFTDGQPNGLQSWRCDVWSDVDNRRAGLLPFVLETGFSYRDYVEWALDVPMYFVMREERYFEATAVTFRQFMDGALRGRIVDPEPNMGDWANHLSTLFPDVRLKRFIEMRGADGGPAPRISALSAFWVGLIYDDQALAEAEAMTADWSFGEVASLRRQVPSTGFATPFRGKTVLDLARQSLAIARRGLVARKALNEDGADESIYLGPLEEATARGTTSAEDLLALYEGPLERSMPALFRHLTY